MKVIVPEKRAYRNMPYDVPDLPHGVIVGNQRRVTAAYKNTPNETSSTTI